MTVQANGRLGQDNNICESTAVFNFADRVQASVHTAEDFGLHHSFKVLGEKGYLVCTSNPWLPEATGNVLKVAEYEKEGEKVNVEAEGNGFLYQVKTVLEALSGEQTKAQRPAARPQDSKVIMEILCQWHQAALSHVEQF